MSQPTVVTRFAPSPTGYLHVGGARTALFNWLLARHHGGKFLLRIEDTDLARSTEAACNQLLDDLRWLGLHWDNTELVYQSRRLHIYNALIEKLIAEGKAYRAYDTPAELDAMRKEAEKAKRQFRYRRRELSDEQIRQYESEGRPHVVRLAMPQKEYRFDDAVLGPGQGYDASEAQDFVIRKSDGMPTYHFAVVVDDHEMGITHILRGQEHLLNTCNHLALQEALGYPRPVYAHLPIIQNLDGSKMGKRDRDKKVRHHVGLYLKQPGRSAEALAAAAQIEPERLAAWVKDSQMQLDPSEHARLMPIIGLREADLPEILVHDFHKNGYLPEGLLNFLALLGWNPGGDRERMTIDEMVKLFELQDINKGNARFDRAKLLAFNTATAANTSIERLTRAMRQYLEANEDSPLSAASDEQLASIIQMKPGFRTFREIDEASRFLLMSDEQIVYQADAVEKVLKKNNGEGLAVLRDLRPILAGVGEWRHDALEAAVKGYAEAKGLGLGKVAQPIRVAVSGGTISPPIFNSLEFLGKEKTLARMDRAILL
jgi:glutamyl/glutaminyl-tRNA synthetase